MTRLALALLFVPALAFGAVCRPNGTDLSIAHPRGSAYDTFHGLSATHQEIDCMELAQMANVVDLVVLVGDLAPLGVHRALDGLTLALTRIQTISSYRGELALPNGGDWDLAHHRAGRNYSADWNTLAAFRSDLMRPKVRAEAARRLTPNLKALLNVNDDLTDVAFPTVPRVPFDPKRANRNPITTRKPLQPCGNGDCSGLDEVILAHHCDTAAKCGEPTTPECQAIFDAGLFPGVALVHYEAGCGDDDDCQWQRRMAPFRGYIDPGWTHAEGCQWSRITDALWMRWVADQRTGSIRSDSDSNAHRTAHVCMNIGADPDLRVVIPEPDQPAKNFQEAFGGDQPCRELLPKLVTAYGIP